MADAAELVARLLSAEAAMACRPFAATLALAGSLTPRVAVPRGHLVRIGGVAVLELLRLGGAAAVEVGEADGFAADELAGAAPAALLVAERATPAELAGALWACRGAGAVAIVVAASPLAALDAGAELVLVDIARHCGGPPTGVIAGRADLVTACARAPFGKLFAGEADDLADTLAALRGVAGDPGDGRVVPLAG